ncbi:MAG: GGDEF domain-containing protein [Usitatibacter sp.]
MSAARLVPSAERLGGSLLAIAALTIVALAVLVMFELDREADLHRDLIAGLQVKDSLESLRIELNDLAHCARLAALAGDPAAAQTVERRAVEVDAELDYLAQHPSRENPAAFAELVRAARALSVNARSVAARRAAAQSPGLQEIDRESQKAMTALERVVDSQAARINDRTLSQLRVGETLRTYVAWLLAGATVVLLGLFGFYRWVRERERDAARRIERLAHYDVLTGLPNRVLLADRLEQELARARRSERGFAILMFDLDGFKRVNDTWGHGAGDAALTIVSERSRKCVRASDTVGRLGGDEFLAILPETAREGALQVAEKLRQVLALPYPIGDAVATMGASIGVAYFGVHGEDAQSLQRAADAALYEAKRGGKNRVLEAPVSAQRIPAM